MPVSIVMPCYNEGKTIEAVIRSYHDEVTSKIAGSELIAVDDCSTDGTYEILERLKNEIPELRVLKNPVNSGHGKSVRAGYEAAETEYVFQTDSDNQFKTCDFWKLYTLKNSHDFILGFRKVRHDPLPRLVLTRIIRIANAFFLGVWIKDANCPFRLMKKSVLDSLLANVDREALAPNIMLSVLAAKRGIRMAEVPVTHYERATGVSSIEKWKLLKFALKGFRQMLLFRMRIQ